MSFDTHGVIDLFGHLWADINGAEQPGCTFPTYAHTQLFDTKSNALSEPQYLSGKPQSARCIFCNKTVAAWGKLPKRKTQRGLWSEHPAALESAIKQHTPKCVEEWAWRKLSRWQLGACRSQAEHAAIDSWLNGVHSYMKHRGDWNFAHASFVEAMLPRLPRKDPAVWHAIEIFVASLGHQHLDIDWAAHPKHGTSEKNQHVLFPFKFGDAAFGVWGMCPCGVIEWRGPNWENVREPMSVWFTPKNLDD